MSSEWLRVMLDEIARKEAEAEQGRLELERRAAASQAGTGERLAGERGAEARSGDGAGKGLGGERRGEARPGGGVGESLAGDGAVASLSGKPPGGAAAPG